MSSEATLSEEELQAAATTVVAHAKLLNTKTSLVGAALDLIDAYEAGDYGPLFSGGSFARAAAADGHGVDRAMLAVQQAVLDDVYSAPGVLTPGSRSVFEGRSWLTSAYYPGAAAPPSDVTTVHSVQIKAVQHAPWGVPVAFAKDASRRPTGLYLSPGGVAEITVPAGMVGAGFEVLVGGQTVDNSNKRDHRRMDRVTVTYAIANATTLVANPLGGSLYIRVPYLADLGLVTLQVTGGVVQAPLFQATSFHQTTNEEWAARRSAPARSKCSAPACVPPQSAPSGFGQLNTPMRRLTTASGVRANCLQSCRFHHL